MNINTLEPKSAEYPSILTNCNFDSTLYLSGQFNKDAVKSIAIVGTRKPSSYGKYVTRQLMEDLKGFPISIVSGLAFGIDSIAHRGALENKLHTTAVIPTCLKSIVPRSHEVLAEEILSQNGALVSLHKKLKSPQVAHYYERNHLLAALADVVVVIEAAKRSGTLITVRYALQFGKPVLAVPGRITDQQSLGTNQLIATGATPLLSSNDIIEALGFKSQQRVVAYTPAEQQIIDSIGEGHKTIDEVLLDSKMSAGQFNGTITTMEINGLIKIESGRLYIKGLA